VIFSGGQVTVLLKSNCVTLLPLFLKETSYFESVTHLFLVTVPLQLLVTAFLKVTKWLLVTIGGHR
jgi:hypothetical protein